MTMQSDLKNRESIVVFGAGAGGIAAAIGAANSGAKVMLLDVTERLGGTVTHALIHTLGGFLDDRGKLLNTGLAEELIDRLFVADSKTKKRRIGKVWVVDVSPNIYEKTVTEWIHNQNNIQTYLSGSLEFIEPRAEDTYCIGWRTPGQNYRFKANAVIDATGNAHIIHRLGKQYIQPPEKRASCGLIGRFRKVLPSAISFPKNLEVLQGIRKAVAENLLAEDCGNVWLDQGVWEDEVYCKLTLPPVDRCTSQKQICDRVNRGKNILKLLLAYLQKNRPEFAKACLVEIGQMGVRDAGAVRGEYTLTENDVLEGRRFSDSVGRCSWPIEYWDPDKGLRLKYLPPGQMYDIPLRCLKVKGLTNVWAVGKCFSGEPAARASARVVGACWAMGQGVGAAAATGFMSSIVEYR